MDYLDMEEGATAISRTFDKKQAEFYLGLAKNNQQKVKMISVYSAIMFATSIGLITLLYLPTFNTTVNLRLIDGTRFEILVVSAPFALSGGYLAYSVGRLRKRAHYQIEIFKKALRKIDDDTRYRLK